MATTDDSVTLTLEATDGSSDTFEVPAALIDRLPKGMSPPLESRPTSP